MHNFWDAVRTEKLKLHKFCFDSHCCLVFTCRVSVALCRHPSGVSRILVVVCGPISTISTNVTNFPALVTTYWPWAYVKTILSPLLYCAQRCNLLRQCRHLLCQLLYGCIRRDRINVARRLYSGSLLLVLQGVQQFRALYCRPQVRGVPRCS